MEVKELADKLFNLKELDELIEYNNLTTEMTIKLKSLLLTYIIMTKSLNYIIKIAEELIHLIKNNEKFRYTDYTNYLINFINVNNIVSNNKLLDNYINNGFYFHTFNLALKKDISINGLVNNNKFWDEDIRIIKEIFSKKGKKDLFGLYKDKDCPIYLDKSLNSSAYYALISPSWFMHFVTGGFNQDKSYYKDAYINRNYDQMHYNIMTLINNYRLDNIEKDKVINFFHKYYNIFCINNNVCVSLISKKRIDSEIVDIDKEYSIDEVKKMINFYTRGVKVNKSSIKSEDLIFIDYKVRMESIEYDKYKRR